MKYYRLLFLFVSTALFGGCTHGQQKTYTPEEMALRRDIAEMLVVGFRGTTTGDTSHIVRDIRDYGIGGVILFEYDVPSQSRPRNITSPTQLKKLCSQLQQLSDEPLFIGIDQEGGYVSRLKEKAGFPRFASAQSTATAGDDAVRRCARQTALALKQAGINLNFAPCVDVNVNPDCPVIGKLERSFSDDPKRVAHCAEIWLEEQRKCGIVSCLKHFPGHGSSQHDTHLGLADVSDTWQPSELEPYSILIGYSQQHPDDKSHRVDMIMTTHVFNSQIDSVYPATLSKGTLTALLRDSMHYDGLIITDDMAMGAMTQLYEYSEALLLTLQAGVDMICLSNNGISYNADIVPMTVDLIFDMVKEGRLSEERIHDSAKRIRKLKQDFLGRK